MNDQTSQFPKVMVTTRSKAATPARSNGQTTGRSNGSFDSSKPILRKRSSDSGNDLEVNYKRPKIQDKTDPARWRMRSDKGCHTWHYLEDDAAAKEWPQSKADKWFIGLETV